MSIIPGIIAASLPEGLSAEHSGMLTTSTSLPGSFAPERPFYSVSIIVPGLASVLYLTFVGTRK